MKKIICFIILLSFIGVIVYKFYPRNEFSRKNAVFEFYAQPAVPYYTEEARNRFKNGDYTKTRDDYVMPGYYIGIDKYRNLYVRGGINSNSLYLLWVSEKENPENPPSDLSLYVGEENMKLDEYIPNPVHEFQKKLSKEEYNEIMLLMDDVEKNWKRDDASLIRVFAYPTFGDVRIQFFKYKEKYFEFSSLVDWQELGSKYDKWGEISTNNIIRVRGILDKYIDSSLDPKHLNYSEWKCYIASKYEDKYTMPEEFKNLNNDKDSE